MIAETPHGHRQEFKTLDAYERSWMWANSRIRFRIYNPDPTCWICGTDEEIELHHLTYRRVGKEFPSDLVALCSDHHRHVERICRLGYPRARAHLILRDRLARRARGEFHNPWLEEGEA